MGILAALLRRRTIRRTQHRAATGACGRLVPRAHPAGRRAAAGARRRGALRLPQTRHAPRTTAVGLDASYPRGHHRHGTGTAPSVAGGPRSRAATSVALARPRWRRRKAGGQFRNGRPRYGTGAAGARPWRLAHRGHAQGRGNDGSRGATPRSRSTGARPPVLTALVLAVALGSRAGCRI